MKYLISRLLVGVNIFNGLVICQCAYNSGDSAVYFIFGFLAAAFFTVAITIYEYSP